ncbi:MAG: tetratricopeptide repeat protein [Candidatus Cloacimonetes bacterium]|nr:tetratricopeptide repeat protein [Candidatus Cloacimonadota bacterium]
MKIKILVFILIIFRMICYGYDFENGGVRNSALGGTGIASSGDISSAVWNPSGLARFNYFQLVTDSRPYLIQMDNDNISQNFAYLSIPMNTISGTFAFTGSSFNSNDYTEGRFGVHYGTDLFPQKSPGKLFAGLGVLDHYISFSEINQRKNAVDLDIGLSYTLNKKIKFGCILGNILRADMALDENNEDKLPIRLGLGVGIGIDRLNFSADLLLKKYQNSNDLGFGLGFEYILAKNLQLRIGMNNHDITGGFGVQVYSKNWQGNYSGSKSETVDFSFLQLSIDYAFQYPLGESHDNGIIPMGNSIESDYGEHFFGLKIDFIRSHNTRKELEVLYPDQFGVNTAADTVYIEKVRVDTVYHTRTVYDTLRIVEQVVNEHEIDEKVQEKTKKIRKSDLEKINKASVHLIAALEYYYSEDYYKAIDECNQAINLAPDLSLSYIRLASIYYRLGDIEEAMYQLHRAEKIDPENVEIKKMMRLLTDQE